MNILFICTAHNSLSQRLFLTLSLHHRVTIEYALSDETMVEAAALVQPDLIICPFLTVRVPRVVYDKYMTLIIHPGPPGDSGPSALDWVLMGDDGSIESPQELLQHLDAGRGGPGRNHWGVTVLQAIEAFDAGPVWAFEQFPMNIDESGLTKSSLYRGAVTLAAISATVAAVQRIQAVASSNDCPTPPDSPVDQFCFDLSRYPVSPRLQAHPSYRLLSVGSSSTFLGGSTRPRPFLKADQRDFDVQRHTAQEISRRIRCSDSQPGCLSRLFGIKLYLYGGIIEDSLAAAHENASPGSIIATRNDAVCIATCDRKGIWITHVRRLKLKADPSLWPKVPAVLVLQELRIAGTGSNNKISPSKSLGSWSRSLTSTLQEVWVDYVTYSESARVAYLYFDFYNGAMSTSQCSQLIEAMDSIISTHTVENPLSSVVLMGGSYFSNGIALNVIEAAQLPSLESWMNINRINDVVYYLLHEFPSRNILTMAGVRGNCAAGGVALATACDIVICGSDVVLNPAYRSVGLFGSEFHTLSYYGRCGPEKAKECLRAMVPMSPYQARSIGLVDHVLPGEGKTLEIRIKNHVRPIVCSKQRTMAPWKTKLDLTPKGLALARATELNEMAMDFYSSRSVRYHSRRSNFVRKVRPEQTPLRFASHRRFDNSCVDEEESDNFDSVDWFESISRNQMQIRCSKSLDDEFQPLKITDDVERNIAKAQIVLDNKQLFPCYYNSS